MVECPFKGEKTMTEFSCLGQLSL